MRWSAIGAIAASAAFAGAAYGHDCVAPEPPALPRDGGAISRASLDAAAEAVDAYAAQTRSYGACLRAVVRDVAGVERAQWRAALADYNDIEPAQTLVWDDYERLAGEWREANAARAEAE